MNYFCLCGKRRAECFVYDPKIDHCDNCLSGGRCFRGDLKKVNDFICICRPCTQGTRCEFSLQAFGFTLDSLLVSEMTTVHIIYISVVVILFCIGLFNNYCSFITFKRTEPRKYGVGNYLLLVTILSQCSLLLFLLKFVSIFLGSIGLANNVSCKMIGYLLSIFTRSTYWLTSWITVSRLLTTIFPVSTLIKSPRLAIYLSIGTFVVLLAMHLHEPFYYQTLRDLDSSAVHCVTNFNQSVVEMYNRVNTLIHHLFPFGIQIISITLMIVLAARSRAKTTGDQQTFQQVLKKQMSTQKELYIIPITIIFSALPQAILSFSLACTQLNNWKQNTLVVCVLLSYVPQTLGFILYVLPSSAYKKEFGQTGIGKKVFEWMFKKNVKKTNA